MCPITPTTSMAPNRSGALLAMIIIRHNNIINIKIIATAPKGSTQIAFETDKFSTYILAYKEHEKETTTKTLDENRFGSVGAAFALTGVMFVATRRKKKDDESEMY